MAPSATTAPTKTTRSKAKPPQMGQVLMVSPQLLSPDPGQPRQTLDRPALEALKQSILTIGRITQPIQVRPIEGQQGYRVIAGFRRWTAASELQLDLVPIIIETGEDSFLQRRIAQMAENSQRAELTELEKAQALMIMWLAMNIEAFTAKAAAPGETRPDPLMDMEPDALPTEQLAALEARLCHLASVEQIDNYISGGTILVPWQRALELIGEGAMDGRARRRLLEVLNLDSSLQDKLAGIPLNPKALRDLAQLPTEHADAIVNAGLESEQPENEIRIAADAAVKAQKKAEAEAEAESVAAANAQADTQTTIDDYDLNDGAGIAPHKAPPSYTPDEDTREVGLPQRGSTPPEHEGWRADEFAMLLGGLEAIDRSIEMANFGKLNEAQQRQVRGLWRSMVEAMVYSGLELPERGSEVDELRWS